MFSFGFEAAPGTKQLFDDVSNDQYLIEAEETIRRRRDDSRDFVELG